MDKTDLLNSDTNLGLGFDSDGMCLIQGDCLGNNENYTI